MPVPDMAVRDENRKKQTNVCVQTPDGFPEDLCDANQSLFAAAKKQPIKNELCNSCSATSFRRGERNEERSAAVKQAHAAALNAIVRLLGAKASLLFSAERSADKACDIDLMQCCGCVEKTII